MFNVFLFPPPSFHINKPHYGNKQGKSKTGSEHREQWKNIKIKVLEHGKYKTWKP